MEKVNIVLRDYKNILDFPPFGLKLSEATEFLNRFEDSDKFELVGAVKTSEGETTILTLEFVNET